MPARFRPRPGLPVTAALLAASLVAGLACSEKPAPPSLPRSGEQAAGPPPFADLTTSAGIAVTYRNGEEAGNFAIIESLGGGVALLDYDGDGLLDVFLPGGGRYEGKTVLGHPCKLFRNLGDFKFEDVAARAGLDRIDF